MNSCHRNLLIKFLYAKNKVLTLAWIKRMNFVSTCKIISFSGIQVVKFLAVFCLLRLY